MPNPPPHQQQPLSVSSHNDEEDLKPLGQSEWRDIDDQSLKEAFEGSSMEVFQKQQMSVDIKTENDCDEDNNAEEIGSPDHSMVDSLSGLTLPKQEETPPSQPQASTTSFLRQALLASTKSLTKLRISMTNSAPQHNHPSTTTSEVKSEAVVNKSEADEPFANIAAPTDVDYLDIDMLVNSAVEKHTASAGDAASASSRPTLPPPSYEDTMAAVAAAAVAAASVSPNDPTAPQKQSTTSSLPNFPSSTATARSPSSSGGPPLPVNISLPTEPLSRSQIQSTPSSPSVAIVPQSTILRLPTTNLKVGMEVLDHLFKKTPDNAIVTSNNNVVMSSKPKSSRPRPRSRNRSTGSSPGGGGGLNASKRPSSGLVRQRHASDKQLSSSSPSGVPSFLPKKSRQILPKIPMPKVTLQSLSINGQSNNALVTLVPTTSQQTPSTAATLPSMTPPSSPEEKDLKANNKADISLSILSSTSTTTTLSMSTSLQVPTAVFASLNPLPPKSVASEASKVKAMPPLQIMSPPSSPNNIVDAVNFKTLTTQAGTTTTTTTNSSSSVSGHPALQMALVSVCNRFKGECFTSATS